jgi:hypothetical protein
VRTPYPRRARLTANLRPHRFWAVKSEDEEKQKKFRWEGYFSGAATGDAGRKVAFNDNRGVSERLKPQPQQFLWGQSQYDVA